jgi:hypothetical protein
MPWVHFVGMWNLGVFLSPVKIATKINKPNITVYYILVTRHKSRPIFQIKNTHCVVFYTCFCLAALSHKTVCLFLTNRLKPMNTEIFIKRK